MGQLGDIPYKINKNYIFVYITKRVFNKNANLSFVILSSVIQHDMKTKYFLIFLICNITLFGGENRLKSRKRYMLSFHSSAPINSTPSFSSLLFLKTLKFRI